MRISSALFMNSPITPSISRDTVLVYYQSWFINSLKPSLKLYELLLYNLTENVRFGNHNLSATITILFPDHFLNKKTLNAIIKEQCKPIKTIWWKLLNSYFLTGIILNHDFILPYLQLWRINFNVTSRGNCHG